MEEEDDKNNNQKGEKSDNGDESSELNSSKRDHKSVKFNKEWLSSYKWLLYY